MTIRVILPVVIDNEEKRTADILGIVPSSFQCEPMIFYNIDNVKQYDNYRNLSIVNSSGKEYIVGLPYEEIDRMILEDLHPYPSAN